MSLVRTYRYLHVFPTLVHGGAEARTMYLVNADDKSIEHIFIALDSTNAALSHLKRHVNWSLEGAPPRGFSNRRRWLLRLKPDLVLTHNWGSFDWILSAILAGLPVVHHEDGFNEDEAAGFKWRRVTARRVILPFAQRVVVPSRTLYEIATSVWRLTRQTIKYIPNGIDVERFATAPVPGALPGLENRGNEVVIGTIAGLRRVKNLPRLIEAFALASSMCDIPTRLVIVGEGPERERIIEAAKAAGVSDRVSMPGFMIDPSRYIGHFDIFALSSDSEQFPVSLIEAMSAGLPVAAVKVGDIEQMVSADNRELLTKIDEPEALGKALARLIDDPILRTRLGDQNRRVAMSDYGHLAMLQRYQKVYAAALGPRDPAKFPPPTERKH